MAAARKPPRPPPDLDWKRLILESVVEIRPPRSAPSTWRYRPGAAALAQVEEWVFERGLDVQALRPYIEADARPAFDALWTELRRRLRELLADYAAMGPSVIIDDALARRDARPGHARGAAQAREAKLAKNKRAFESLRVEAQRLKRMESMSASQIARRLGCSRRRAAGLLGRSWKA